MIVRTTDAWDRIRAADPMTSIDLTAAPVRPTAGDLLRRIGASEPSVPPPSGGAEDVLTVFEHRPDHVLAPHRRRFAAAMAAVVVVGLVGAGAAAVWRHHDDAMTLSSDQQTTATGYAKTLLEELAPPEGSRRVDEPPIPELGQSLFVDEGIPAAQVAWWTVRGSFTTAVAEFVRRALPPHWKFGESSTGELGPHSHGWIIEVRDPQARFVASITVAIAEHGAATGMAARVDPYAIPVRTPAQVVPASVGSADFSFTGGGSRSYSSKLAVTVTGTAVTNLAAEVNATPTFFLLVAPGGCNSAAGSATVTFRSGSQRWSLRTNGNIPCRAPTLTGTSGSAIDLTPSAALLANVLAAAGLPADYFTR